MNVSDSVERIQNSHLPKRYQNKLIQDLMQLSSFEDIKIDRIVLFGSCARNEHKVGSDLDLLILSEEKLSKHITGEIASALEDELEGISTDIIFYTNAEFQNSTCMLVREIRKDGIVLWEDGHA